MCVLAARVPPARECRRSALTARISSGVCRAALPAIGWAAGIERLLLAQQALAVQRQPDQELPTPQVDVCVCPLDDACVPSSLSLAADLRAAGLRAITEEPASLSRTLARASQMRATAAALIGSAELAAGTASVKLLGSGTQHVVQRSDAVVALASLGVAPPPS